MDTKKRIKTEHEEQREFVQWFRQNNRPVRIFAIANGGLRGKGEALRLKVEGVSAGVPDLYVPAWHLWIEMKRIKGGVVSLEQKDWHEYLQSIGDTVLICKGCEEAINAVDEFIKKDMAESLSKALLSG